MLDYAERVRGMYEALAQGDFVFLRAALHAGVEWHATDHPTCFGPEAVLSAIVRRLQDFDGFAIDVRRIVGAGSTVFVEARCRATGRLTGKILDAQVAHVWDFRDGKVVRFQQYSDTEQFADVAGRPARREQV